MTKYTYDLFKSFNEDAKARDQDFLDIKKGIEEGFSVCVGKSPTAKLPNSSHRSSVFFREKHE